MRHFLIAAVVAAAVAFASPSLRAQDAAAPQQNSSASMDAGAARGGAAGQELSKASKEEAKGKEATQAVEDPNAQFRESPSVKWLAIKLHTDSEHAFWISMVFNFILVGIGVYILFGKTGLPGFFPSIPVGAQTRRDRIKTQLETSRAQSEDANRRLREIESKLGQLGSEISALSAQAESQSRDEEARLKTAVEEEKQKIVSSAQQEIAAASASAQRELRTYAAGLAVELAAKKISIDPQTDQVLVRDFAEQLGRNGN